MYLGNERRATPRCPGPRSGAILLKEDSIIECTVRDFSLGGVGIELPAAISILSTEFDLTFGQIHSSLRNCMATSRSHWPEGKID
jgi:hypothetical protein